jgi:carbonic anhydrase
LKDNQRLDRLCELNVLSQARHVARTTIVEDAWERGQELSIHSWIYRLDQGILTPLRKAISRSSDVESA